MPQALIFFEEEEDLIITKVSKENDISKHAAIKKIVLDYEKMRKEKKNAI